MSEVGEQQLQEPPPPPPPSPASTPPPSSSPDGSDMDGVEQQPPRVFFIGVVMRTQKKKRGKRPDAKEERISKRGRNVRHNVIYIVKRNLKEEEEVVSNANPTDKQCLRGRLQQHLTGDASPAAEAGGCAVNVTQCGRNAAEWLGEGCCYFVQ
ncbi:Protein of unknown function [Gryllus bimaculatus]|nr:Protein of unknown function [Gryllus bimaculatus]